MTGINYKAHPVYVLDDEKGIAMLIEEVLADTFQIYSFTGSTEFKQRLQKRPPAVALIDYHLGDITGLDLLEELPDSNTQYLMISGDRSNNLLEKAINEKKIVGYIAKPFDVNTLKTTVMENYKTFWELHISDQQVDRYKQQAKIYQQEVSNVNSSLYETIVSSHSNYKMADRIAMVVSDQLGYIYEKASLDRSSETITQLLSDTKVLISSINMQFNIDRLFIIDAILETMIKLLDDPRMTAIDELETYLQNNLPRFGGKEETSLNTYLLELLHLLHTQIQGDSFAILPSLEFLSDLPLADLISSEFLVRNELPQPDFQFMLIIHDDVPVFRYHQDKSVIDNLSLITNFFIALNGFSEEMMDHGAIKTIQFEQGVVMVRQFDDIIYCCLVDYETMAVRLSFEAFVQETMSYLRGHKASTSLDDDSFLHERLDNFMDTRQETTAQQV